MRFQTVQEIPKEKAFLSSAITRFLEYKDPTLAMDFFPLSRSNVWNPHPIIAGIYFDVFFHMSAGSRFPLTRTTIWRYHRRHLDDRTIARHILHEIAKDAEGYVEKLRFGTGSLTELTRTIKDLPL